MTKINYHSPYWIGILLSTFTLLTTACQSNAHQNKTANKKAHQTAKSMNIHNEITIAQIQEAYRKGDYSIADLTKYYLKKI